MTSKRDDPEFTDVIGTPCFNTSYSALVQQVENYARSGSDALSVDFTNVHIVTMRRTDEDFASATANVDWFVPDSQVLRWAVNLRGGSMQERVYGPTFLDYAVRHCRPDTRHYFLGASQECLDLLLVKLKEIRPDLNVVGSHHGYFGDEDNDEVVADILSCNPDLIWVGLGTPRQQHWISENLSRFQHGVLLAVGFAFDVNAGTKKDAPAWMGRWGLTWLYRLSREPLRLFTRYFYYNTLFLWFLLLQFFGKKFPPRD